LVGKDHLEDMDVDGTIILQCILGKEGRKTVEWIHLVQDRDQ
jgi:hypothetical protein